VLTSLEGVEHRCKCKQTEYTYVQTKIRIGIIFPLSHRMNCMVRTQRFEALREQKVEECPDSGSNSSGLSIDNVTDLSHCQWTRRRQLVGEDG
jgi:hypothetical protein